MKYAAQTVHLPVLADLAYGLDTVPQDPGPLCRFGAGWQDLGAPGFIYSFPLPSLDVE